MPSVGYGTHIPISCATETHRALCRLWVKSGRPTSHLEGQIKVNRSEEEVSIPIASRALSIVRNHFQKEEEVLFSIARQTLDEETQIRLGKAWAETRRVTIA